MKQLNSEHFSFTRVAQIFFLLFLVTLFFPIKYTFLTSSSIETGIYSDFTSISLYLSDILLILSAFFIILPRGKEFYHVVENLKWLLIIGLISFLANLSQNWSLSLWFWLKLAEFIVAYGTITILIEDKTFKSLVLRLFVLLCFFQSFLALVQFHLQRPLGLFKIGEQQIYVWNLGIAKLAIAGTKLIRGYGTFPHPNPLSAFLTIGLLISMYLLIKADKIWKKTLYSCVIFMNTLGLAVTFSRAAFFVYALGLALFFGYLMIKKQPKDYVLGLSVSILAIILAFGFFGPYLSTRATIGDQAVVERGLYNKIGLNIIKNHFWLGTGPGLSVLHMQQYSPRKLLPWEIQPIHNYFLLSAAELGVPGMLILIWIFYLHLKGLAVNGENRVIKFSAPAIYPLMLAVIFTCCLVLMIFDHYFYTLEQTQLLLWLILGLMAAETKKSPERG